MLHEGGAVDSQNIVFFCSDNTPKLAFEFNFDAPA
jgi:hypothetical protein